MPAPAKATNPRVVAQTTIKGWFGLPLGLRLFDRPPGAAAARSIDVSTVQLDGGHLEDPLGICEPECGYETAVFYEGCSFFSVYIEKYDTRAAAEEGHDRVVQRLMSREQPLAIQLPRYCTYADDC